MATPTNMSQAFAKYASLRAWCRARKVWRQGNIVGAYTEYLVANALDLDLCSASRPGCDAIARNGQRYEIKGLFRASSMWSSWDNEERLARFDVLAIVIFDGTGRVDCAHLLPAPVVRISWKYGAQKKWWLTYHPALWKVVGVREITESIRAVVKKEWQPSVPTLDAAAGYGSA